MRKRFLSEMIRKPARARIGIAVLLMMSLPFVLVYCDSTTGPKKVPSYCEIQPLPVQGNTVQRVGSVYELRDAVQRANSNGGSMTIMMANGIYQLNSALYVNCDDLMIRSRSGNRESVIIRHQGMTGNKDNLVEVNGTNFTIADVTIGWVNGPALNLYHDSDDALVHNVRFVDASEFMIRIASSSGAPSRTERGTVEWCLFEYTAGEAPQAYTGGIIGHQAEGWIVHHNVFRGFKGPAGELAGYAILFWDESSNTIIEHNTIYNCDRGIGFGLGSTAGQHTGGMIRNNMVHTTMDVGIGLQSAVSASVYNNTVWVEAYFAAIEYRWASTQHASIINNLANAQILGREGATGVVETNVTNAELSWFVDPAVGDLCLADSIGAAVDLGQSLTEVELDFYCEERPKGSAYDIGADEY
ncbi:MAG: right-handed parallel beta-helix repeat-containing protein [bacterium]|nr:MAG: right-handed parallel beta-helix repeat-containing protein [bacterium]